jgi:hypothetical protein
VKSLKPVILATWEVEIGRIAIWGQPWQKVRPHLNQPAGHAGANCHPNYGGKHKIEESWSWLAGAKKWDLISKVTRGQQAWLKQLSLPSKWEDLSSNHSTAKRKKQKNWRQKVSSEIFLVQPLLFQVKSLRPSEVTLPPSPKATSWVVTHDIAADSTLRAVFSWDWVASRAPELEGLLSVGREEWGGF